MRHGAVRRWTLLGVFVLVASVASAQTTPSTRQSSSSSSDVTEQVKSAEKQLINAAKAGDKQAIGNLLQDNVTWVNTGGKVFDKEGILNIADKMQATVPEISDLQVKPFGNTAIVTGVARGSDGNESRFIHEWISRDGQWKLAAHEGVPSNANAQAAMQSGAPSGQSTTGSSTESQQATGTSGTTSTETAGGSVAPTLTSSDERSVWQADQSLKNAYLAGDAQTYGKYTADDFVRLSPGNSPAGKTAWLQTVKANAGKSQGRIESSDVQITVDGDTARIVSKLWGTNPGGDKIQASRVTRIFKRQNGTWQQVAFAIKPIQEQ